MTTVLWDAELAAINKIAPRLQVKPFEDSWFYRLLIKMGWHMAATTLFNTIRMKSSLIGTDRGANVLAHERVHVTDQRKYHVFMFISYVLLLPTVLTMRAFWEWRAYKITLRNVWLQYHDNQNVLDYYAQWVTSQFTGWGYFFMFPFRGTVYRWCQEYYKSLKM